MSCFNHPVIHNPAARFDCVDRKLLEITIFYSSITRGLTKVAIQRNVLFTRLMLQAFMSYLYTGLKIGKFRKEVKLNCPHVSK